MVKLVHGDRPLWDKIEIADRFFTRLKGLLGKGALKEGEGLLIRRCSQVHTFHMHFPLDLLYLTTDMQVLKIVTLDPEKIGPRVRGAAHVLEVAANSAKLFQVCEGDTVSIG